MKLSHNQRAAIDGRAWRGSMKMDLWCAAVRDSLVAV